MGLARSDDEDGQDYDDHDNDDDGDEDDGDDGEEASIMMMAVVTMMMTMTTLMMTMMMKMTSFLRFALSPGDRRRMQAEEHRISLHAVQTFSQPDSFCNNSHAAAACGASDSSGSVIQSPLP